MKFCGYRSPVQKLKAGADGMFIINAYFLAFRMICNLRRENAREDATGDVRELTERREYKNGKYDKKQIGGSCCLHLRGGRVI
jgi:hypothetical protein